MVVIDAAMDPLQIGIVKDVQGLLQVGILPTARKVLKMWVESFWFGDDAPCSIEFSASIEVTRFLEVNDINSETNELKHRGCKEQKLGLSLEPGIFGHST